MSPIAWLSRLLARAFVVSTVVAACSIGQPAYGDTIDGIACDGGKNVTFQATISLWLVKGNQRIAPTSGVGSTGSSCNYWVRTEAEEGVVHIRAPHEVRPTLATFLTIWDRTIPLGSGNATEFRTAAEQAAYSSTDSRSRVERPPSSWSTAVRSSSALHDLTRSTDPTDTYR
jgi:hypothetical protein